jgi:hypothetical protein
LWEVTARHLRAACNPSSSFDLGHVVNTCGFVKEEWSALQVAMPTTPLWF